MAKGPLKCAANARSDHRERVPETIAFVLAIVAGILLMVEPGSAAGRLVGFGQQVAGTSVSRIAMAAKRTKASEPAAARGHATVASCRPGVSRVTAEARPEIRPYPNSSEDSDGMSPKHGSDSATLPPAAPGQGAPSVPLDLPNQRGHQVIRR